MFKIANLNPETIGRDCLQFTLSVDKAANCATKATPYHERARIPQGPWQSPGADFATWVNSLAETHPRCGIMEIPPAIVAPMHHHISHHSPKVPTNPPPEARERLVHYLHWRLSGFDDVVAHGVNGIAPALETVTFDKETRLYLGMHLDSWDSVTFEERDRSRTRVCVNLGPSNRYFLFVPSALRELQRRLAAGEPNDRPGPSFFPDIFDVEPPLPVFRLRVQPGQAYIADTDNLVHDASSIDAAETSYIYTVRGYLPPRA